MWQECLHRMPGLLYELNEHAHLITCNGAIIVLSSLMMTSFIHPTAKQCIMSLCRDAKMVSCLNWVICKSNAPLNVSKANIVPICQSHTVYLHEISGGVS